MLAAAVAAAFSGAALGNKYLRKLTVRRIQQIVAATLTLAVLAMATGLI